MLRFQSKFSDEGEKKYLIKKYLWVSLAQLGVGLCLTETGSCFVEILVSSDTSKCELEILLYAFKQAQWTACLQGPLPNGPPSCSVCDVQFAQRHQ